MTLQELLDELRGGILRDTSDAVAGDDPSLWSQARLVRYINQAQTEFAKISLVLRQKRSLQTVYDQADYELDPSVIAIISARFLGNGTYIGGILTLDPDLPPTTTLIGPDQADLARAGHNAIQAYNSPDTRYYNIDTVDRLPPGKPQVFYTDEVLDNDSTSGVMSMRLFPRPTQTFSNCVVEYRCVLMPAKLTADQMQVEPDIPEEYHLLLLDYAAYMALRIVDHEAGDPQRAADFLATFKDGCEKAREQVLRKMFTPQNWGFGRSGYSWIGN